MIMNWLFRELTGVMMAINHNWIILLASLLLTITNGNHIFCRCYI